MDLMVTAHATLVPEEENCVASEIPRPRPGECTMQVFEYMLPTLCCTGAANDIERATDMAHKMVCEWGMSDQMGMIEYGETRDEVFLANIHPDVVDGIRGRRQSAQDEALGVIETATVPAATALMKAAISFSVSFDFASGGGMTCSGSSLVMRCTIALSRGLPGTIGIASYSPDASNTAFNPVDSFSQSGSSSRKAVTSFLRRRCL